VLAPELIAVPCSSSYALCALFGGVSEGRAVSPTRRQPAKEIAVRVLRISHSGVVDAWRERERAIRSRGVDLQLLSAEVWNEGGVPVRLEPRSGEPVEGARTLGSHPALFVYDPRPLWRALGRSWDVLDIHEEPFALATAEILALRALRRQRAAYVLYSAQNLEKRLPAPFRWLQRRALQNAGAVSVCNAAAGAIVERRGFPGRADVIPLGVDTAAMGEGHQTSTAAHSSRHTVGYAGRLVAHKGVDVLLEAVAGMPGATLRVAGDGPMAGALRERAERPDLAGRVVFLGAVQNEELASFYASLDVLAVPSLTTATWVEQFGRVAVEGMAAGVPVVASDSGALPDVVGEAGLLVAPGDAMVLRAALKEVLDDTELAEELRRRGLRRAAESDWKSVAERYIAMYRRATHTGTLASQPDPAVVVVAYGAPELLRRTLSTLTPALGSADRPVLVVDNSSSVQVQAVCQDTGARYVDAGRNGGFGYGVNLALGFLNDGEDVLLLNPDAVVTRDDIARLAAALHADPRLASVAPAQVDEDGRPVRVAWPFPTPFGAWLEAVGLGRLGAWRPGYAIGSILLLRAGALRQVGGFDERFFLYAEETDWARRAARLGWSHRVVPTVTALHTGAATSADRSRREIHFHGAQERYYRKHHGGAGWLVARGAQIVGSGVRAVVLPTARRKHARHRLEIYARGPARVESRMRETPQAAGSRS
jgi:glycosyltransferase involved in cell wall biosynthesis/GT2 family glycosyltransferase